MSFDVGVEFVVFLRLFVGVALASCGCALVFFPNVFIGVCGTRLRGALQLHFYYFATLPMDLWSFWKKAYNGYF